MFSRLKKVRDDLNNQVADQVKALQLGHYTAESEKREFLVTNDNIHIQCLIDLLDHILLHGLREVNSGYWPYISKFTHTETIKQIALHPYVSNDIDKGVLWVFIALHEGLLECYFNMFMQDLKTTRKYYVRNAFLRDHESVSILKTLLSGIDSINLSLDLVHPYMGYPIHIKAVIKVHTDNVPVNVTKQSFSSEDSSSHNNHISSCSQQNSVSSNSPTLTPTSPKSLDFGSVSTITSYSEQPSYDETEHIEIKPNLDSELSAKLDNVKLSEENNSLYAEISEACNGELDDSPIRDCKGSLENAALISAETFTLINNDTSVSTIEMDSLGVEALQDYELVSTLEHSEFETPPYDSLTPGKKTSALSAALEVSRGIPDRTLSIGSTGSTGHDVTMDDLDLVHLHKGKRHRRSGRRRRLYRSHSRRSEEGVDTDLTHTGPTLRDSAQSAPNDLTNSEHQKTAVNHNGDGVTQTVSSEDVTAELKGVNFSCSPSWKDIVYEGTSSSYNALKHLDHLKDADHDSDSVISGDSYDEFCRSLDLAGSLSSSDENIYRPPSSLKEWEGTTFIAANRGQELESQGEQTKLEDELSVSSMSSKNEMEYEAIMLCGLPRRASLSKISSTSADRVLNQNALLSLALNVYQEDGEKFYKMIRVSTGHLSGQLQAAFLLITTKTLYILRKGGGENEYRAEYTIILRDLRKIEIGLNCQNVSFRSIDRNCVLETGDEAVTRNIVSAVTTVIAQGGGSPLSSLVTSCAVTQEANIKKWIAHKDMCQVVDVDVVCFSLVQWYCVTGPESVVAMLSYQVLKEGYLLRKQNYLVMMSYWQKSYFVLMHGTLYEYENQGDKEAKLVLDLKNSTCGGCRRISEPNQPYSFEIISSDGSSILILSACTEDEAADWIFKLCQTVADAFDVNEACLTAAIPCGVMVTKDKVIVHHSDTHNTNNFAVISKCAIQDITKLVVDNQLPNYCILKYDNPEYHLVESSWFLWFKTEFELGKFEKSLADAWKQLFQVDLQFVIIGEGPTRRKVRELGKHATAIFDE